MAAINPCVPHKIFLGESCIFCGLLNTVLTDEHVFPLAISGRLVLQNATCEPCRVVTGKLEGKLLRGPFWPIRRRFGVISRRPNEQPEDFPAILIKGNGVRLPIAVSADFFPEIWLDLFPAKILEEKQNSVIPSSRQMALRHLGQPRFYRYLGKKTFFIGSDKVEYPVNLDTADLMRFLAKVAVAFIHRKTFDYQLELQPIRELVLGNILHGMNYIGCNTSNLLGPRLPGAGLHRIYDYRRGQFHVVALQLFVPLKFEPTPIYEVVFPIL